MREPTIARNYAEALLALARKADDLDGWGAMISDVAAAVQYDERLRRFLESPRIDTGRKNEIIATAFQDRLPRVFVRFLQAVITHRRQRLIPEIATEYHQLVDDAEGRVHAQVTVAREPDDAMRAGVTSHLSRVLQRTVVPHFVLRPDILGGTIIRVGDTVMDGSVRRRLAMLRQRMLSTAGAA
ncbi:MAG TPA: ATP synthase F1 subunit delta [Gemmatimonadaceae bacterium]|nr:ATP synthase F1 subunit delta [Gemmatimonadaceae bacterium]